MTALAHIQLRCAESSSVRITLEWVKPIMPTKGGMLTRSRIGCVSLAFATSLISLTALPTSLRPLPAAACQVMQAHIAELIEQHRQADELDDAAFGHVVNRFYEAQTACTAGRYDEGLAIYGTIPIGRLMYSPLR